MSASSVLYVLNLNTMERFYTGVLGMARVESGDTHRVLESEAWTLVLVQAPPRIADTITLTDPPRRRSEAVTKLVFAVSSITEVRTRTIEFGGEIESADREWTFLGSLRSDGIDPEGNVIQLRQLGVAG